MIRMVPPLVLSLAIGLAPIPALAHKIIASVFASGSDIEGEIGMSNGEMAANLLIEVVDGAGNKLGEVLSDADGFFLFTPTQPVTHIFRANLGAGHVAEAIMEAEEVAAIVGKAKPSGAGNAADGATIAYSDNPATQAGPVSNASAAALIHSSAPTVIVAALSEDEKGAIAKIVRDETRPLRQEIAAYKEKNNLQTILGGIGYIFGLFGFGFYIAARRKLKDAQ